MINQIKYFQSVVKLKNFTKAAEENFISQSAISQQIQALEKDLGVKLLNREGRKFSLTKAGEFFYKKSLILINDFERICEETAKIANNKQKISVGSLRHYNHEDLKKSIAEFNQKFPEILIEILIGTHEELYNFLRQGKVDLIVSDLRRNPSEKYVNFFLAEKFFYAEFPVRNNLTQLEKITFAELKNTPMILIAPQNEQAAEEIFYREYFDVKSEIIFAEDLESAHLMVLSNLGYFLTDFKNFPNKTDLFNYVPIFFKDKQISRKYFAFWLKDNSERLFEDFAEILKRHFK